MGLITDARNNITEEEMSYRAGISEGTWFKVGGAVNFVNNRQYDSHGFYLNGAYVIASGQSGLDGLQVFQNNAEIFGFSIFNLVSGSAGATTVDIHWLSASGVDNGSIFSVKPSINSTAPNNAYGGKNLIDVTSQGGTGITLPTFSKTQFDAFNALRFDVDSTMTGPEDFGILIHFRPR